MALQILLALLYFYTAPFNMTVSIVSTLIINLWSILSLMKIYWVNQELFFTKIKILRLIFLITLFALEFFIYLTPDPVSISAVQSFINDAEVFITGMLVGALWQDQILKINIKNFFKKL